MKAPADLSSDAGKGGLINCEDADKSGVWAVGDVVIRLMHGMLEISAYIRLHLQKSYMAEMD
jgi:hypothetical protein